MAGYKNALRYGLTGDHVDAQEAMRIGLVNKVLPDQESLMSEAFRLAERIAMNTPETVAANKYIATLGLEMLDAARDRGMCGFLEVRDGTLQPKPFGPGPGLAKSGCRARASPAFCEACAGLVL